MSNNNNNKLVLHCGAETVEREVVDAIATPAPVASQTGRLYVPVPHGLVIDSVKQAVCSTGLAIADEHYALSRGGSRVFGLLTLAEPDARGDDYALTVGLRNSHDKSFPVGLCLGSRVFVCDNLSFSGEVDVKRKHTRYIREALPGLINQCVAKLVSHRGQIDQRIEAYKDTAVENPRHLHDLVLRAFKARAIPAKAIPAVVKEFEEPRHPEFRDWSLWSCFNAFTEVLKSHGDLVARTERLHGVFDAECGPKLLAV